MVCLNLGTAAVVALALPGTTYFAPIPTGGEEEDYEATWNATQMLYAWPATPFSGIPILGDIFSGIFLVWNQVQLLVDGFPRFLGWICDNYIRDADGLAAFTVVMWMLRAMFAIVLTWFVVELITGRNPSD